MFRRKLRTSGPTPCAAWATQPKSNRGSASICPMRMPTRNWPKPCQVWP